MIRLQRLELDGKRFVVISETEYERLCREAGETVADTDDLPVLPKADARGRFPALEYARVSLARDLIRARREFGLSQQRLAELAGVRQETISRLESGKHSATAGTVDKIMNAVEAERNRIKRRRR